MHGNDDDLRRLRDGRHGNAFAVLGPQWAGLPAGCAELVRRGGDGLIEGPLPQPGAYRLDVTASVVEWTA